MAFTLSITSKAPDFDLPGVDGKRYTLADFKPSPILLICFTCNHCPYVIGNEGREAAFVRKYAPLGVAYVAINSNDPAAYADDDFPHMQERARTLLFTWPYLHDATQKVAAAYGAIKTPQFYLFDKFRSLRYVGRMDNSPRDASLAHTHDLADAMEDLLAGREVRVPMTEPVGCTVKWRGKDKKFIPSDVCDLTL